MSETAEVLDDRFFLVHIPEGFRSPGCVYCGDGAGLHYVWLMDRELSVKLAFLSRDEALTHLAELDEEER